MIFSKHESRDALEKEIHSALNKMSKMDVSSKEYSDSVDNLNKLLEAKEKGKSKSLSPDTLAVIAGNLLGIILILNFEKLDVVTSKALGFVLKGRV